MARTGPTNPHLQEMVKELKKKAIVDGTLLWKRLATDLEKPSRQRRIVNLAHINKYAKPNETVVVPGKILGNGTLDQKLILTAWSISAQAREKLIASKSEFIPLAEFIQKNPKGKKVRIIG